MPRHDHQPLAKPFDRVFATKELALTVRWIVQGLLDEIGVRGPQDPRLAATVFRDKLHVNVGNWLVASLLSRKQKPSDIGLLLRQDHGLADWRSSDPFSNDAEEPPIVLAYVPYDELSDLVEHRRDELLSALRDAAQVARRRFDDWAGTPYRHAHVPWMARAYYDEDLLKGLLHEGLPDERATRLHVAAAELAPGSDQDRRSLRLEAAAYPEEPRDAASRPALRRGDVLLQVDGDEAPFAGLVLGAGPSGTTGTSDLDDAQAELGTFDVSVRGFETDIHPVPSRLLALLESRSVPPSSEGAVDLTYVVPDEIASSLLADVLDSAPEDIQELVAWTKQAIAARLERVDPGRRPLPAGPITDQLRGGDVRVVKIAPGRGGVRWQDFLDSGIAAVGWEEVGDLLAYEDYDTFLATFRERYPYGGSVPASAKKARELWTMRELKPGDLIVANRGISEVLGVGEVIEPGYEWRDDREDYRHTVRVRWDERYGRAIPSQRYWAVVTVLDLEPESLLQLLQTGTDDGDEVAKQRVRLLNVASKQANLRDVVVDGAVGDRVSLPVDEHRANADLSAGDIAVLWQSGEESGLYGLGEVLSAPQADPDNPEGSRSVELRITTALAEPIPSGDVFEDQALSGLEVLQAPSLSVFVVDAPEWEALERLLTEEAPAGVTVHPPYDVEDVVERTGLSAPMLERWVRAIQRKKQAILYGPPGTGKTYVAKELAKHLVAGGDGIVQVLQFHAATAYEDFIQGLRPEIDASGNLSYVLAPGGFLKFVREASGRQGVSVLILDEINRADLARVFGELMYLLEYRNETVALAAGGKKLSVPENVRILGTMNTADRSVALVDHALRRRFAFLRLQPDLDLLRSWHQGKPGEALADRLAGEVASLHRRIDDPHLELGISYFLVEDLPLHLPDIWRMEIEPYLEELFFDEADPLGEFAWKRVAVRLGMS